jgi:hypothetical protein
MQISVEVLKELEKIFPDGSVRANSLSAKINVKVISPEQFSNLAEIKQKIEIKRSGTGLLIIIE